HLPGNKVVGRIAEVRGLEPGTPAVSPATFPDLTSTADYRELADEVRSASGGIPIGAKLSAQHIEADIDAALEIGVDYIILDGRGGGTGAAPAIFRDHISVPTIPALARARRHLDACESNVTLVITGGLRSHTDFVKALALGADAIAVSNAAMQAIGCLGMRACNTDNCPVGIATQQPGLRQRLVVDDAAQRLTRFFGATVELMKVLARACGHSHLNELTIDDLTTFDREMHHLAGVPYGGITP
ncbi:MAG: FMN-binding glutamate synthase family protein, partial [Ilumatobacteraceae bacterium]